MKLVQDYKIISHGIYESQYFPGCGTAFTEFNDVATGIGDIEAEAFDDALDDLAQLGWETDEITTDVEPDDETTVCVGSNCKFNTLDCSEAVECQDCELHYYVSIRVK